MSSRMLRFSRFAGSSRWMSTSSSSNPFRKSWLQRLSQFKQEILIVVACTTSFSMSLRLLHQRRDLRCVIEENASMRAQIDAHQLLKQAVDGLDSSWKQHASDAGASIPGSLGEHIHNVIHQRHLEETRLNKQKSSINSAPMHISSEQTQAQAQKGFSGMV